MWTVSWEGMLTLDSISCILVSYSSRSSCSDHECASWAVSPVSPSPSTLSYQSRPQFVRHEPDQLFHLLQFCWRSYNRSQSGSLESAVCSKRASALVIGRYTFSPRSAHALIDSCLFLFSRKKYSSKYFVISGIAGRQISSRIRRRRYSNPNHSRRYLFSSLWIRFHVLPPFAANSRTTCAVASLCSDFLKPSLYQRHCAAKSSNESGSSSQTFSLSVTFDIATVVSSATSAHTSGYLSNVRVSDSLSNAVTVTGARALN